MRAVWHVMVGGGSGAGAASSDGVSVQYPGGDGIPVPWPEVRGVWDAHASAVAGDAAGREFWAAGASDSGILDGPEGRESAGSARELSDAVSDGWERGQYWSSDTGGECSIGRTGGGGATVDAAPAGAECR